MKLKTTQRQLKKNQAVIKIKKRAESLRNKVPTLTLMTIKGSHSQLSLKIRRPLKNLHLYLEREKMRVKMDQIISQS